jgi:hypothetical protein
MVAVAELEAGMISARTKAALAAAKKRGKKLGGNRGVKPTAKMRARSTAVLQERADARAFDVDSRKPANRPLNYSYGNREGLVKVLSALGYEIPQTLIALAAANKPLGTTSFTVDVHTLDRQLAKAEIRYEDRLRLKTALRREGLL